MNEEEETNERKRRKKQMKEKEKIIFLPSHNIPTAAKVIPRVLLPESSLHSWSLILSHSSSHSNAIIGNRSRNIGREEKEEKGEEMDEKKSSSLSQYRVCNMDPKSKTH